MTKAEIKAAIIAALLLELESVRASAAAAHEGATGEDSKAENQYDTRGLEQSYLAGAQASRAEALEATVSLMKQLKLRTFADGDAIALTALVSLDDGDRTERYFISPEGGGIKAGSVVVVTPQAPVGKALIGKRVGDFVEVRTRGGARDFEVIGVV